MDLKNTIGGGRYGEYPEDILKETKAGTVVLIVIGGDKGHGFSIASRDPLFDQKLPHLLRYIADDIEHQNSQHAEIPKQ